MPSNSSKIVVALGFYSFCNLVSSINITKSKFLTLDFDELHTLGDFRPWQSVSNGLQTPIIFILRLATKVSLVKSFALIRSSTTNTLIKDL